MKINTQKVRPLPQASARAALATAGVYHGLTARTRAAAKAADKTHPPRKIHGVGGSGGRL